MQFAYKRLRGSENLVGVKAVEIVRGPKRRDKLPERDILRLSVLHGCFVEIMNDTLEEWVDSFCHDFNYEREIKVWERMAACYLRCLANRRYSVEIKRIIFEILLGLFSGADSSDLQKGFDALPRGPGTRLYAIVTEWLQEWQNKLGALVEDELSDQKAVQQLMEQSTVSSITRAK